MRIINVQPGWVVTEGLTAALQDQNQAAVIQELGLGEVEELRENRNNMLRPEETVWEIVNKPSNVYIHDILIKDKLQSL